MEDSQIRETAFICNSLKRLDNWLFFIAFGLPLIQFGFNFLNSTVEWDAFYSNLDLIQIIWCLIFPTTALILVWVEAYGLEYRIRQCKYYYYVTLVIYESLCVLSIFAFLSALRNVDNIQQWIEYVQKTPYAYMCVTSVGTIYCLLWLQNTFVHVLLCWLEIIEKHLEAELYRCYLLFCCFLDTLMWVIPIAGSATMVFIDIAQNEPCFPSPCELVFIASIWACHACANLATERVVLCDHIFLQHSKVLAILYIVLSVLKFIAFPSGNGLNFSESILNWILFLSIGRKLFLDLLIGYPKYVGYFKHKFSEKESTNKLSAIGVN